MDTRSCYLEGARIVQEEEMTKAAWNEVINLLSLLLSIFDLTNNRNGTTITHNNHPLLMEITNALVKHNIIECVDSKQGIYRQKKS